VVPGKTAATVAAAVILAAITLAVIPAKPAVVRSVVVTLVVPAPVVIPGKPAAVQYVALASVAVVPDAVAPSGKTAVKTWPAMTLQRKSVAGMELAPCVILMKPAVMAYAVQKGRSAAQMARVLNHANSSQRGPAMRQTPRIAHTVIPAIVRSQQQNCIQETPFTVANTKVVRVTVYQMMMCSATPNISAGIGSL
jgi:hypothetical protein